MRLRSNKTTSPHVQEEEQQHRDSTPPHTSTTKFVGPSKYQDGSCARVTHPVCRKQLWLGTYDSAEEASMLVEEEQRIQAEDSQDCSLQIDSRKSSISKKKKGCNAHQEQSVQGGAGDDEMKKVVDQSAQCLGVQIEENQDCSLQIDSRKSRVLRKNGTGHGKYVDGVNKSTSGKYGARVKHPVSKKYIWLGTFGSAEEASMICSVKRKELENEICDKNKKKIQEVVCDEEINKVIDRHVNCAEEINKVVVGQSGQCLAQCSVENHTDPCMENQVSSLQIDARKERISKKKRNKIQDSSSLKIDSRKAGISKKKKKKKKQDSSLQIHGTKSKISMKKKSCLMRERRIDGFVGVTKSKSGKFGARIKHPVTRKDIWLGTYKSAEEASTAYLTKKIELKKEVRGKRGGRTSLLSAIPEARTHVPCSNNQDCAVKIEPIDSRMEELPIQRNMESVDKELYVDSSVYSEYGAEILLRTESGVPLMDSHGFLLGSWSWIDDLRLPIM